MTPVSKFTLFAAVVAVAVAGSLQAETRDRIGTETLSGTAVAPTVANGRIGTDANGRFLAYSGSGSLAIALDAPATLSYVGAGRGRIERSASTSVMVSTNVAPARVASR